MSFELYIPSNLTFQDYIAVCQCSRTFADGYDRKDKARLQAALAPIVTIDYRLVIPSWELKTIASSAFIDDFLSAEHLGKAVLGTQHLLGAPYFKSVTEKEIVVEWQQLASHGRREQGSDYGHPMAKIVETSDGRSFMQQTLVKTDAGWRISVVRPEVLFQTGDFRHMNRPDEVNLAGKIGSIVEDGKDVNAAGKVVNGQSNEVLAK